MAELETFDVVVVGGGPAGATAATDLARHGRSVLLLDKAGRIKPCGGAVPPRLIRDFEIPDHLICAHITSARIISPTDRHVDMPIDGGFVGMVNRDVFDEWLRERARDAGAVRRSGSFEDIQRESDGTAVVLYRPKGAAPDSPPERVRARTIIGADGANSTVARHHVPDAGRAPFVFAYHEIIRTPTKAEAPNFDGTRCDVYYRGTLSPDFYGWIFPHGDTTSIGTGSMHKGFSLREAVGELRRAAGLEHAETLRHEGAPIPLRPLKRWDNGRDIVLAGDAAGVVAPASGEGIFYAMTGGRVAAEAVQTFLVTGDATSLKLARKHFMADHGRVFWVLEKMQNYWYSNDKRRERFVSICGDRDVQQITWDAYMNKRLVRSRPFAHARIFFKNIAHLTGLVPA
ncbi:geranylgeranyl diphosphate reductase [Rhodovastum atsumiense]|uniref:Geranylgeranyl diphosphate reductase n=1 Tax=Rhodovastum atsumiense TaxID=504468 RepID=A0A5M6IX70_9PROT|nr:geranylgeranyl diphosphate reductase [Rhodovastum atsumiense]KAA5612913.1 geranylgeranyl diphosphate reductase [Rhodovastum atsumiense]